MDPAVVVVGVSTSRLAIAVHPADDIPGGELGGAGGSGKPWSPKTAAVTAATSAGSAYRPARSTDADATSVRS